MPENVRLVIWDLDDTFWAGTLSEGGIERYLEENHRIVVAHAERGIVSSICSKNDFATVRAILKVKGIWDYFIFPSVDWSVKSPRLASIIEATQLRPSTVLYIDDNPTNLAEARAAIPELQVADPSITPTLLSDPRFQGKDDRELTRLKQYKVLERRQSELKMFGADNADFLRRSNIRISIATDIERHLDRAVELINRTNQLNFTKVRLPDDIGEARAALLERLNRFDHQAGLVRVIDDYGDYGYCGFYVASGSTLEDYCFSCRILGLGVETWLYRRLGKPNIVIRGEVVANLNDDREIDWITYIDRLGDEAKTARLRFGEVRCRGGCELENIGHYMRLHAAYVIQETNRQRGPFFIHYDSTYLALQAGGIASRSSDLLDMGFADEDLKTAFFKPAEPGTILIYSGWGDLTCEHYHDKATGSITLVHLIGILDDVFNASRKDIDAAVALSGYGFEERKKVVRAHSVLRARHETPTGLTPREIEVAMRLMIDHVPANALLFVLLPATRYRDEQGTTFRRKETAVYNALLRKLAARRDNVALIPLDSAISSDGEIIGMDHFNRIVYFRVFEMILSELVRRQNEHSLQSSGCSAPGVVSP